MSHKAIEELWEVLMFEFISEAARASAFQARPEIEEACKVLFQDLATLVLAEGQAGADIKAAKESGDGPSEARHRKRRDYLRAEIGVATASVSLVASRAKLIAEDQENNFAYAVSRCFYAFGFVAAKIIALGAKALAEGLTEAFQSEMEKRVREVFA